MPAITGTTATAEKPWQRQKTSAITGTVPNIVTGGVLDCQGVKSSILKGEKKSSKNI
jgi:hypothetical protein